MPQTYIQLSREKEWVREMETRARLKQFVDNNLEGKEKNLKKEFCFINVIYIYIIFFLSFIPYRRPSEWF